MTIPPLAFDIDSRYKGRPGFAAARRDIGDTRRSAHQLNADVKRASASIAGIGKSALIGATGLASFAAAIIKMKQGLEQFDRIAKVARQNGLDGEFYQTLAFMAGEASVEVGVLDNALRKFTVAIGEAKNGSGTLYTELKRIDPALLDLILNAETAEQRIRLYSTAVANAASAEDRAALVKAGFGQRGADLVRVLELGAGAMDQSAQKARDLGNIIENEVLDQAEEMQNRLGNAADALDKQLNAALISASPLLVNFYENMATAVKVAREWSEALDDLPGKLAAIGNSSVFAKVNDMLASVGLIDESLYQNLKDQTGGDGKSSSTFTTSDSFGGGTVGPKRFDSTFSVVQPNNDNSAKSYDFNQWNELLGALEAEKKALREVARANDEAGVSRGGSAGSMRGASDAAKDLASNLTTAGLQGQQLNQILGGGVSSVVSDIMRGVDAMDALKSAGLRVAEQFVQMQLQAALFGQSVGGIGGGGGGFGGILGALFGGFRAGGGAVEPGKVYGVGERGFELFMPDVPGEIISNDSLRQIAGRSSQGGNTSFSLVQDNRGADAGKLAEVQQEIRELKSNFKKMSVGAQSMQNVRGTV